MKENYVVSARKYRPATFDTVVGQKALTHTLKTAIATERLAHAYLFCGPRGVGKTSCARIFAKTINCMNRSAEGEACNECESCRAFNEQRSYNIVELDAASNNGVNEMRGLTDQVRIPPQVGKYKVFIIDEVHMLSTAAFNAFLKTLEEPPEYAIFILATTEKQKVIPTILSRCQIYDFARITVPDIVAQLQYIGSQEGITAEPAALNVIAQKADGAMRDALSIYDQVAASTQGNITYRAAIDNLNVLDYDYYFRLDKAFLEGDVTSALLIYKEIRDKGFDSLFFINGLAQHLRDLMVASSPATASLLEMNEEVAQQHVLQSAKFAPTFFYRAMDLCNDCDINYRNTTNKQFLVELTLIKLCQLLVPQQGLPEAPKDNTIKKITPAQPATTPQVASQPIATPSPTPAPPQPVHTIAQPVARPVAETAQQQAPQPYVPINATLKPTATDLGTKRVMISGNPDSSSQKKVEEKAPQQTMREPFTPQQLMTAWNLFIEQNPQEKIIINTMRNSAPQQIDDTTYRLVVESEVQATFIESKKSKLLNFLRTEVKNDMLAINVEINATGFKANVMTQRELFNSLSERSENFKEFVQEFKLTLS